MGADENSVQLRGTVAIPARYSHDSHGVEYHVLTVAVARLSGASDMLQVLAARPLLSDCELGLNSPVEIQGHMRSYNNKSGQGNRLVITVLAVSITPCELPAYNQVLLSGTLCKPPCYRTTPLGREICDLLLAVGRRYGRSDYLPCIAWGAQARTCAALATGDRISLEGRIQSRSYAKVLEGVSVNKTAYEISITRLSPALDR